MSYQQRFWVSRDLGPWVEVSLAEYAEAEKAAGFNGHPPATSAFGSIDKSLRGTTLPGVAGGDELTQEAQLAAKVAGITGRREVALFMRGWWAGILQERGRLAEACIGGE